MVADGCLPTLEPHRGLIRISHRRRGDHLPGVCSVTHAIVLEFGRPTFRTPYRAHTRPHKLVGWSTWHKFLFSFRIRQKHHNHDDDDYGTTTRRWRWPRCTHAEPPEHGRCVFGTTRRPRRRRQRRRWHVSCPSKKRKPSPVFSTFFQILDFDPPPSPATHASRAIGAQSKIKNDPIFRPF